MKNFFLKLTLFIVAIAAGYLGWRNWQLHREVATWRETVELLQKEKHDRLQQPVAPPAVPDRAELFTQIEKQTSALRGLPFKNPVTYKNIGREELRQFLQKKLHEQYTPPELHDYGRTLETLGLIPAGTDLMEAILGLYDEQVAAFYVPEERALYTFKDMTFAGNLDKVTLSHELTHALQDQNYDLTTFPLKVKDNDDLALATAALIEGDATLEMAQFYGEHLDVRNMLGDVLGGVMGQKTAKFQAAPAYFKDMMLFPYQQGTEFVTALFASGGTEALNQAFEHPPASTKEILHPDKFLTDRRAPEKIALTKIEKPDWRLLGENVLGEFGLRSLLAQSVGVFEAQRAAEGWNGDRFQVYEQGTNGPCFLLWETAWEDPQQADEFISTYRRVIEKRGVKADIKRTGNRVSIRQANDEATLAGWRQQP